MTETTDPQAEFTDPFCGSSFAPAPHPTHRYMRGRKAYTCPGETETAASPAPVDRAAILREAADIAEAQRQFEPATGARKSAQVSENVGILRAADELRRMVDEAQQAETQGGDEPFGTGDCTCIPFVREGGTARYCRPGDTVDQISGWEPGLDCPHHRQPAAVSQPGKEA